jgi:hypothetical protein
MWLIAHNMTTLASAAARGFAGRVACRPELPSQEYMERVGKRRHGQLRTHVFPLPIREVCVFS